MTTLFRRDPTAELLIEAQLLLHDLREAAQEVREAASETKAAAADLRNVINGKNHV